MIKHIIYFLIWQYANDLKLCLVLSFACKFNILLFNRHRWIWHNMHSHAAIAEFFKLKLGIIKTHRLRSLI
ncbi:Uncharacterised protein [Mycobacteroides abscessus subsp. abscessus]|nr:Uncharacterised protein [Mycobacteroides abscessus subsp. abscessus]